MATQTKYSYVDAGFNGFMSRSIASSQAFTLPQSANDFKKSNMQSINFDQAQTSGTLGSVVKIGQLINLDGVAGRISTYDDNNNEVVRLGELGD